MTVTMTRTMTKPLSSPTRMNPALTTATATFRVPAAPAMMTTTMPPATTMATTTTTTALWRVAHPRLLASVVALHSVQPGRKRISLPGRYAVTDLVSGEAVSGDTDLIEFDLQAPATHVYLLEAPSRP